MSSENSDGGLETDPENRLLWRMNRWRMDAEALRDSVLAVTGKLDRTSTGPSLPLEFPENVGNLNPDNVNPPSFRLAKFRPGQEYQRTVYLPIIRSGPQAGPAEVRNVFDFTQPAESAGQRSVTAVPTQALFLMNGPLLRERAKDLASKLIETETSDDARLASLWLRVLNRPMSSDEQLAALGFLTDVRSQLSNDSTELIEQRAWSELCHALLASNEFLMRL
jgi:hypothetical protein